MDNNETITETTNDHQKYFEFLKDNERNYVTDGQGNRVLALKPEYRGEGDENYVFSQRGSGESQQELPEMLEIPDTLGEIAVTSLAPGMFAKNKSVKGISLPPTVTVIPEAFCLEATNLRTINNTENITKIGYSAFRKTRIKKALFPSLTDLDQKKLQHIDYECGRQFLDCAYLEIADIGQIETIPPQTFSQCTLLREVIWKPKETTNGEKVEVSIGQDGFSSTCSLRELPLLAYAANVDVGAFFYSGISTSLPAGNGIDEKAFPTADNTTDFWTGVKFTPRRNRITTKLSQSNSAWAENTFLLDDTRPYSYACSLFSVMHIHSALTGKYYSHPDEFVQELKDTGLSKFLYYNNWPGQFQNVAPMFEALGYRTEVHGIDSDLSRRDYQALVNALAEGAYIYTQVGTRENWLGDWDEWQPNGGHAVVIYGINDLGEMCVLDSSTAYEHYRADGFEPGIDIYTYTMPYQNMVGPSSNFVIVYPPVEKTSGDCAGCAAANACCTSDCHAVNDSTAVVYEEIFSDTLPEELPTGVTVALIADEEQVKKMPEQKKGYLTVYHLFASAATVQEEWQPIGSCNRYFRYATDIENWSDWYISTPTKYTMPEDNSTGA